jgi:hypothetical protein
MKTNDQIGWPHAVLGLAAAGALVGVFWAGSRMDEAKYRSPEYWHYKYHWDPTTPANCDSSCKFLTNSREKNTSEN